MKIYNDKTPESQGASRPIKQATPKTASVQQPEKTAAPPKIAPTDKVDISGGGKAVVDIVSSVQQLPDVREARVQEIKQAVDSGAYKIDASKVAESILKNL